MPRPSRRPRDGRARWLRTGLTLIELVVVLAILVVIGGVAVMNSGLIVSDSQRKTTDAVLRELRDVFVGSAAGPGYITDCGRAYDDDPNAVVDRYRRDMRFLYEMPASDSSVAPFSPVTRIGWRGPYLKGWISSAETSTEEYLVQGQPPEPWGAPLIRGRPRDGWGTPIVLQIPEHTDQAVAKRHARLVSAGPNGVFEVPTTWLGPPVAKPDTGDDVFEFLEVGP